MFWKSKLERLSMGICFWVVEYLLGSTVTGYTRVDSGLIPPYCCDIILKTFKLEIFEHFSLSSLMFWISKLEHLSIAIFLESYITVYRL
jgi:hypothetical protein